MKKSMLTAVLIAAALVFSFVSCKNSYVEKTPEVTTSGGCDVYIPPAGPDFVYVEGTTVVGGDKFTAGGYPGVFIKGRTVTIADFFICKHEVTQEEFEAVMGTNPSSYSGNPADGDTQEKRPVENINWYVTIAYCNKRSIAENLTPCYIVNGIIDWENLDYTSIPSTNNADWNAVTCDFTATGYRLPTEVEWEYAALGGKAGVEAENPTDWSGANDSTELGKFAWYGDNSQYRTHQVMTKTANSLGIHDMNGNVWEWCWDWDSIIDSDTSIEGASTGTQKIMRGMSYNDNTATWPMQKRLPHNPTAKFLDAGFRVARSL